MLVRRVFAVLFFQCPINTLARIFADQIVINCHFQGRMHQIVDTVQGICTKTVCKKISIEFLDVAGLDVDKRLVRKRCGSYVFIPQVQIVFSGAGLNLGFVAI